MDYVIDDLWILLISSSNEIMNMEKRSRYLKAEL